MSTPATSLIDSKPATRSDGAVIRLSHRALLLVVFATLLGIPIALGRVAGIEVPLSDLAVLLSLLYLFLARASREKTLLLLAIGLSVVGVLTLSVMTSDGLLLRSFVSLAYFFRPYLLFFAGYVLIREFGHLKLSLRYLSLLFSIVAIAITAGLLLSGSPVRVARLEMTENGIVDGSALAGSLLGLPLYATWGVHSLAVYYASMLALVVTSLLAQIHRNPIAKAVCAVGLTCLLYLVIFSFSRTAILGTVLFFICLPLFVYRSMSRKLVIYACLALAGFAVLMYALLNLETLLQSISGLSSVIDRSIRFIQEENWDRLSSGRLTLMQFSFEDLWHSPLFGVGFRGYQLFGADRVVFENADVLSSPHNQFLTAAWKMGLLPFAFYMAFLILGYRNIRKVHRSARSLPERRLYAGLLSLVWAYAFVFCMVWDVLLVPLIGSLVMYIVGGVSRIAREQPPSGIP